MAVPGGGGGGINIGGVSYTLTADPSPLLQGLLVAERAASQSASRVGASTAAMAAEFDKLGDRIERSLADMNKAASKSSIAVRIDGAPAEATIAKIQKQINGLKQGQQFTITARGEQAQKALDNLQRQIRAAEKRGAVIHVEVDTREAQKKLTNFQEISHAALRGFAVGSNLGGGLILGAGLTVATGTAVAVQQLTNAILGAFQAGIQWNAQLEDATTAFTVYTGSIEKSRDAIEGLRRYADVTPFNDQEVIQSGATFIKVVDGDVQAMQKLVKMAGSLAATNPQQGLEGATRAIQELLGGDTTSIVERFNVPRGQLTAAKQRGESGLELVQTALKLAHASDELVNALGSNFSGRLSTFTANLQKLGGVALKPVFDALSDGLGKANNLLDKSAEGWGKSIAGILEFIGRVNALLNPLNQLADIMERIIRMQQMSDSAEPSGPLGLHPVGSHVFQDAEKETMDRLGVSMPRPLYSTTPANFSAAMNEENPAAGFSAFAEKAAASARAQRTLEDAKKLAEESTAANNKAIEEAQAGEQKILQALESRHAYELKGIEAGRKAALKANADKIDGLERERDAAIKGVEDALRATMAALEQEQRARQHMREQEDRAIADQRQGEDRNIQDARHAEDYLASTAHEQEIRHLHEQEEQRSKNMQHAIDAIEHERDAALRALDDEAEAARRAASARIDGIEQAARADAERHRQAMQSLQDEENSQLEAISRRMAALDAAERRAGIKERDEDLNKRLSSAQVGLASAKRFGDPYTIIQAQRRIDELTKEQERNREADKRDSRRRALQEEADDIRKSFAAERRQLEERERKRQAAFDAEKKRVQDELQAKLDSIKDQKESTSDQYKGQIESLKEQDQAEKDEYDQHVQRVNDQYNHDQLVREATRAQEDRLLADRRQAEDRALADRRRAEDEDFAARQAAATEAARIEKERIADLYNGPDGSITQAHKATDAINAEFDAQVEANNLAYEEIKGKVKASFEEIINGYKAANTKIEVELKAHVKLWEDWSKGTLGEIEKTQKALDKFIETVQRLDKINNVQVSADTGDVPRGAGGDMAIEPGAGGQFAGGYSAVVRNADPTSYWTDQGTHGGHPAADIFAPKGSGIYAPVGGTLSSYSVPQGGNAATLVGDDGRAYYFAHGNVPFRNGRVERGDGIGQVGNTGNAQLTSPHLHFAIASDASLFDRYNGSGDIWGDPSYWGAGGDTDSVTLNLFGKKITVRMADQGSNVGAGEITQDIRRKATQRAIDPNIAVRLASFEGGVTEPMRVGIFETGRSFWPFQLHYGGGKWSSWGNQAGLGNSFTDQTGLQPGVAANWDESNTYALDYAKKHGWGAWYGRGPAGIGEWEGIQRMAAGGVIAEPTLLYGLRQQRVYAYAGESGVEDVVPRQGGGMDMRALVGAIRQAVANHGHDIIMDSHRVAEATHGPGIDIHRRRLTEY